MIVSTNGQKIIERIPEPHILTETDGPYIQIRGRTVQPEDIGLVHEYLARKLGTTIAGSIQRVKLNFQSAIRRISE